MKIDKPANINPLEGQPIFYFLLALFLVLLFVAILLNGFGKVLTIVLMIPVLFFLILIAHMRLTAKWRKIHFPLTIRYARALGYAQGYNKDLTIDEKMDLALMSVLNSVYPSMTKDEIAQYYEQLMDQLPEFMNQIMITALLRSKKPEITDEDVDELSRYFSEISTNDKFRKVYLVISDVIQKKYDEEAKQEYIFSIIKGKAI